MEPTLHCIALFILCFFYIVCKLYAICCCGFMHENSPHDVFTTIVPLPPVHTGAPECPVAPALPNKPSCLVNSKIVIILIILERYLGKRAS